MPKEVMYILITGTVVALCGLGSICEIRKCQKRAQAAEEKVQQLQKRAEHAEDLNEVLREENATIQSLNHAQRETILQLRAERDALYKEVVSCGRPKSDGFM